MIITVFLILLSLTTILASTETDICKQFYLSERKFIYGKNATKIHQVKSAAGRVFWTQTGGPQCTTNTECILAAYDFRWIDMHYYNLPEIRDNFLIGGDGDVYEGLGWEARNLRYPKYKNDISIAFIGNFNYDTVPEVMQQTAINLVLCGKKQGYIDTFFSLYGESDITCQPQNYLDDIIHRSTYYAQGGQLSNC